MSDKQGFVKIYRSLLDWEWYDDINTCRLFLHLLLTVNYKPGKWHGRPVRRGERITSRAILAKETGLSIQQVRTSLDKLRATGEITIKTTSKNTVLSINNYTTYQADNQQKRRQTTSNQPASNQQITTIKESKKLSSSAGDARVHMRENDIGGLVAYYQGNGFGMIARSHLEDMEDWLDGGRSPALIQRAMQEAVDMNKVSWAYVKKIITRCERQQVTTVEEFDAEKRKRENQRAEQRSPAAANPFTRDDL